MCLVIDQACCGCVPSPPTAQDDWEGSWPSTGGKAPPSRQTKGAYREHPYGRYWLAYGRWLPWQLSPICNSLLTLQKVISLSFVPFFYVYFMLTFLMTWTRNCIGCILASATQMWMVGFSLFMFPLNVIQFRSWQFKI